MNNDTLIGGRLNLYPDPAANPEEDLSHCIHFYESTLTYGETGEPLLSIATRGRGMRLTREQVSILRDALGRWLADA